jgi:glycosyltransferase involved in cell wall biosynthesis
MQWMSGYGLINRGLRPICDSEEDLSADVHLWISPPYSFGTPEKLDPAKINIGVTMGERDDLHSYGFPFVAKANLMDLIITTSTWQYQVMQKNGITRPIEICLLGHDHEKWFRAVREVKKNRTTLIVDRGRDHGGGSNELAKYFDEINYMNCRTPKPDGTPEGTERIKTGRYTQEQMFEAYHEADVFLKWGREGWGFPILEAMSSGCLVITNCVHLPYLRDKENCLTFRNSKQLQAALQRAANHPCTAVKEAGQQTAAELTWEKARERVLAAIEKYRSTRQ